MAQQPAKLRWKKETPFGLSASQFGMALGFCAKVSHFVDYQRNIVGTEQEFKGNVATAHGIKTEPKSRSLYEVLTGIKVFDGGFFLSKEGMLGCSPDGQSFYYEEYRPVTCRSQSLSGASPTHMVQRQAGGAVSPMSATQPSPSSPLTPPTPGVRKSVAIKINFNGRRSREEEGTPSPSSPLYSSNQPTDAPQQTITETRAKSSEPVFTSPYTSRALSEIRTTPRRKLRLLEIKSPFMSLYDCRKEDYRPYGIPPQYMCQIQGQMAIAGADICDFFVYLDSPKCEVEAWRVYRSDAFWKWAKPKLLQVVNWVRVGLPEFIDKSFEFQPFDFSTLRVEPLVFPFCISTWSPLQDPVRFQFFNRFQYPYNSRQEHRGYSRGTEVAVAQAQLMEDESIAALYSDAVKFLFDIHEDNLDVGTRATGRADEGHSSESQEEEAETTEPPVREAVFRVKGGMIPSFYVDVAKQLILEEEWNRLNASSTQEGAVSGDALRRAVVTLRIPTDWELGMVEAVVHWVDCGSGRYLKQSLHIPFSHRNFFILLVKTTEDDLLPWMGCSAAVPTLSGGATPLVYSQQPLPTVSPTDSPPIRLSPEAYATLGSGMVAAGVHNGMAPPSQRPSQSVAAAGSGRHAQTQPPSVVLVTPDRHDKGEPLSQHIRLSLTPQRRHLGDGESGGDENWGQLEGGMGRSSRASSHGRELVPTLARMIDVEDFLDLLQDAADCTKLIIAESLSTPVRTFWRGALDGQDDRYDVDSSGMGTNYTLVIGPGDVVEAVAEMSGPPPDPLMEQGQVAPRREHIHRSVTALVTMIRHRWTSAANGTGGDTAVLCYVEDAAAAASDRENVVNRRQLLGPSLFLYSANPQRLFQRAASEAQRWTN